MSVDELVCRFSHFEIAFSAIVGSVLGQNGCFKVALVYKSYFPVGGSCLEGTDGPGMEQSADFESDRNEILERQKEAFSLGAHGFYHSSLCILCGKLYAVL